MTTKEKACRYDALQVAIKYTIEHYERVRNNARNSAGPDGIMGAYAKGMLNGFDLFLEDLRRWVDKEASE